MPPSSTSLTMLAATMTPPNALQHIATYCDSQQHNILHQPDTHYRGSSQYTARTATCCNTLQHTTAAPPNALQHTASLQRTATLCNTLQHPATSCNALPWLLPTHCNTLQHIATYCSTLQHTATQVLSRQWLQYHLCESPHHPESRTKLALNLN